MGIPFQHVGINVSSADLCGGAVGQVLAAALERERVPLTHVILEVTETVYMGRGDQAIRALRADGIRVALDDFGTGFASLTHLLTVPVDVIKIDKLFVDHLEPEGVSVTIVEGLIRTAEKMGIRIVAERIETEEQVEQLRAIGCTLGQVRVTTSMLDDFAASAARDGDNDGIRQILEEVAASTGMGFVALARVTDTRWIACQVVDQIDFGMSPGEELRVSTTICNDIREHGNVVVIDDVAGDPEWLSHPAPSLYGFKSYVSLPIVLADGSFYGTLCAIDPEPRKLAGLAKVSMLKGFAERIASILSTV